MLHKNLWMTGNWLYIIVLLELGLCIWKIRFKAKDVKFKRMKMTYTIMDRWLKEMQIFAIWFALTGMFFGSKNFSQPFHNLNGHTVVTCSSYSHLKQYKSYYRKPKGHIFGNLKYPFGRQCLCYGKTIGSETVVLLNGRQFTDNVITKQSPNNPFSVCFTKV